MNQPICGVYALVKDGVVVYVGQSMDVSRRVRNHNNPNPKIFDEVQILAQVPKTELNKVERAFIEQYKPISNMSRGGRRPGAGRNRRKSERISLSLPPLLIQRMRDKVKSEGREQLAPLIERAILAYLDRL